MRIETTESTGLAMNEINLDRQSEDVRKFFLTLSSDRAETALRINGHVIAFVVPKPATKGRVVEPWTDAKNDRRCDLIDKRYSGDALTPEEVLELNDLQEEVSRHVQRVAPRQLNAARKLHQELLMKAGGNPES